MRPSSIFIVALLVFLMLGTALADDPVDENTLWTFVVNADGGFTVYDSSSRDSVLDVVTPAHVVIWVVAHQHLHDNPQVYLAVFPKSGFPTTEAKMSYFEYDGDEWTPESFPSDPRDLTFSLNTATDPIPFPTHGIWGANTDYDVFPEADEPYDTFTIGNTDPGSNWDLNPEGLTYDQDMLEAYSVGREGNFTKIHLWLTGGEMGQQYVMHVDSYGPASNGPDFNPFSHDATIVINVVPLVPVAAGFTTMATCFGLLLWRKRELS